MPDGLEWFWRPFLLPADAPLITIPNHPLLRAAHDGDTSQTLAEGHEIAKASLPDRLLSSTSPTLSAWVELWKALLDLAPDHKTIPPSFQVLLTTTVENSVRGNPHWLPSASSPTQLLRFRDAREMLLLGGKSSQHRVSIFYPHENQVLTTALAKISEISSLRLAVFSLS